MSSLPLTRLCLIVCMEISDPQRVLLDTPEPWAQPGITVEDGTTQKLMNQLCHWHILQVTGLYCISHTPERKLFSF